MQRYKCQVKKKLLEFKLPTASTRGIVKRETLLNVDCFARTTLIKLVECSGWVTGKSSNFVRNRFSTQTAYN